MIALDSDVLIEMIDRKSEKGGEAFKRLLDTGENFCTTAVSMHEVLFGLYKHRKPLSDLLQLKVLDYTRNDALLSSKLELHAEQIGKPIARTDAMVAATTINNNISLFTFNLKHFEPLKQQGLKLL